MAEIDIERKQRSSPLPWVIVGIVVLALIAWWVMSQQGERTTAFQDEPAPAAQVEALPPPTDPASLPPEQEVPPPQPEPEGAAPYTP
jgi:hypothetical protein